MPDREPLGDNEIIPDNPGFLIAYGIYFLLFIFALLLLIASLVSFTTRIRCGARLTAVNGPKPLVCRDNLKITALNFTEGDTVRKGDVIAVLEATASLNSVVTLEQHLRKLVKQFDDDSIIAISAIPVRVQNLGELQNDYQLFMKEATSFAEMELEAFGRQQLQLLQKDLQNLQFQHRSLLAQQQLQSEDVKLSEEGFAANQQLREQRVVSAQEYRNEKSKLIGKRIPLVQLENEMAANGIAQNEKLKEIQALAVKSFETRKAFENEIFSLLSKIEIWKSRYLIIAGMDGILAFTHALENNSQLKAGETVAYIIPAVGQYYAEMTISQTSFGKVALGQKVLIKLSSYPFAEYGALTGHISQISKIATDSGYLSRVELQDGLNTTFHKAIMYKEGLTGYADIVVGDQNLLRGMLIPKLSRD